MKRNILIASNLLAVLFTLHSEAADHFVSPSGNHTAPYTNWVTAATNIQDAVDEAVNGDAVWVTNGTYVLTSEITVPTAITIQSVNGPDFTAVDGNGVVRCFNLGSSFSTLAGFTVTNGLATGPHPEDYGGGIYCTDLTPVITNCHIAGNTATSGGGVFYGTVYNSLIVENTATFYGGGLFGSTIFSSLLTENAAQRGSAVRAGTVVNCTVVKNDASDSGAVYDGSVSNSIVWDNTAVGASNNLDLASAFHTCSP